MDNIILAGSGGCMREIFWQLQEQRKKQEGFHVLGYVDCVRPENEVGISVGGEEIAYLGDDDYLLEVKEAVNVAICVGSPVLRRKLAKKYARNPNICFPNLILGNTAVCADVRMGAGCIISMDARISTNVIIGNFVFMNTGSMVCHDGRIGDFVTLSPDVKLAGGVHVASGADIGIGSKVIQGIHIGENVVTGAGSVIIRDVEADSRVAGVPVRDIMHV